MRQKGTIQVPGYGGGGTGMSGAADPETGFRLCRIEHESHSHWQQSEPECGQRMIRTRRYSGDGRRASDSRGLRLLKPPYGRITGYDMNQGTIAFQIPNGDTPPNIKAALDAAGLKNIPADGSRLRRRIFS